MNIDECVIELVQRGSDDWVHIAEVYWVAKRETGAQTVGEAKATSLVLIREVLSRGLMEAGEIRDAGFVAWPGSIDEVMERIERAWSVISRRPYPGDVCWLNNTRAGEALADESPGG